MSTSTAKAGTKAPPAPATAATKPSAGLPPPTSKPLAQNTGHVPTGPPTSAKGAPTASKGAPTVPTSSSSTAAKAP